MLHSGRRRRLGLYAFELNITLSKLKLEFAIFNQLMSMVGVGLTEGRHQAGAVSYELHNNPSLAAVTITTTVAAAAAASHPCCRKLASGVRLRLRIFPTYSRPECEMQNLNGIYMTRQVQVLREDATNNNNNERGDNLNTK